MQNSILWQKNLSSLFPWNHIDVIICYWLDVKVTWTYKHNTTSSDMTECLSLPAAQFIKQATSYQRHNSQQCVLWCVLIGQRTTNYTHNYEQNITQDSWCVMRTQLCIIYWYMICSNSNSKQAESTSVTIYLGSHMSTVFYVLV